MWKHQCDSSRGHVFLLHCMITPPLSTYILNLSLTQVNLHRTSLMPHLHVSTLTNVALVPVTTDWHYSNTVNMFTNSPLSLIIASLFPTHSHLHLTAFHHHNPPTQIVVLVEKDFGGGSSILSDLHQPSPQKVGTSGHLPLHPRDY